MEIWKDVPGYEGLYQVSNEGRVKRAFWHRKACPISKQIMNPSLAYRGYRYVGLNNNRGVKKIFGVHRLVALAFIPNPENKNEVNHIDHNPSNNHVGNLEWITTAENIKHSWTNPERKKNGQGLRIELPEIPKPKKVPPPSIESIRRYLGIELTDSQILEETKKQNA